MMRLSWQPGRPLQGMSCCYLPHARVSTCFAIIRIVGASLRRRCSRCRNSVSEKGRVILRNGLSISRDSVVTLADSEPARRYEACGDGSHTTFCDTDAGIDGARHGVQCQRDRRGKSIPGSGVFPEASNRMARFWLSAYASHLAHRLSPLEKTLVPHFDRHDGAAGGGVSSLAGSGCERGETMVAGRSHFDPAGRDGETRDGDVSGGLCDQEVRQAHPFSGRTSAGVDRDRSAQRIGVARTGFGHGCRDGFSYGRSALPWWCAHHASPKSRTVRNPGRIGAHPWVQLPAPAVDDIPGALEGRLGCRVSNHAVVSRFRQRRAAWSWIGGREAKTLLLAGGPYGFCTGACGRGTWSSRYSHCDCALCSVRVAGISYRCAGADAVRQVPGNGHYAPDRNSSTRQCGGCHGTVADKGIDAALCQLWRLVRGCQFCGRRDAVEHLTGPARWWIQRRTR